MNDWVLITGASSGIGLELARCFAADGFPIVLAARHADRLQKVAAELESKYRVATRVVPVDLSDPAGPGALFEAVKNLPIGVLVNNAGFGMFGNFAEQDRREQLDMIQVNVTALAELCHRFAGPMRTRGRGRIWNVASVGAFVPGPLVAVYYATKAFVYSFSLALSDELAPSGVQVSVLCPGTTRTPFFERGRFGPKRAPATLEVDVVARLAYRDWKRGRRVIIPGWQYKVLSFMARHAPVWMLLRAVRRFHSPPRK
ncbi:MAG: SDR family oxidoreductase [Verrucomicrobiota bacterium]